MKRNLRNYKRSMHLFRVRKNALKTKIFEIYVLCIIIFDYGVIL